MHHPVHHAAPPASEPEPEFVATRDMALPAVLWGVAMAAVVSGALAHEATSPQRAAAPTQVVAVSVLAA